MGLLRGRSVVSSPAARNHIRSAAQLADKLSAAPALLLSASVPYRRAVPKGLKPAERERFELRNQHYLETTQPARIRSAVVELTRAALMRGVRLVFGAHPAISPMVLSAARDAGAPELSVVVFQSGIYEDEIPASTLELADWQAGKLFITQVCEGRNAEETKARSLAFMREMMVSVPGLRAAVFVGGMDGVEEEAQLFHRAHDGARRYALASTGSAALDLFERDRAAFSGSLRDARPLAVSRSYALVAKHILDDLGLAMPGKADRSRKRGR